MGDDERRAARAHADTSGQRPTIINERNRGPVFIPSARQHTRFGSCVRLPLSVFVLQLSGISEPSDSEVGGAALCNAAWVGHTNKVCRLLWEGADVNARGNNGATALTLAVTAGHTEIVELLLGCGADTACADCDGRTPLHLAAKYGRHRCIELLHVAEADVQAASEVDGITAFHLACVGGHVECLQLLLRHGADAEARTHAGLTGAELVNAKQEQERRRRDEVLRLLKQSEFPQEDGTQTDLRLLMGDGAAAEEAKRLRVKVELAEFRDEFRSVKTDMLSMRRQMSGMITQMNGFSGAINELSQRSSSQVR